MVNALVKPRRSASARSMRTHMLWNVDTHMPRAAGPTSAPRRSRISAAALFVNVIARIRHGATSLFSMRFAMRYVSTRVLPLPAPASTSSGPSVQRTASFWAGFRESMSIGIGRAFFRNVAVVRRCILPLLGLRGAGCVRNADLWIRQALLHPPHARGQCRGRVPAPHRLKSAVRTTLDEDQVPRTPNGHHVDPDFGHPAANRRTRGRKTDLFVIARALPRNPFPSHLSDQAKENGST